ncbi:MAG: AMP-binding protein [Candidatus Rokuibacteriota bacterium]
MIPRGRRPSLAPYQRQPLPALLEATAGRLPGKAALIGTDGRGYSYAQLWTAARGLARFLQREAGVRRGDTVAIVSPNCPEYAVAVYGALLAGAKVTGLNPLFREREITAQLTDADAVVAFAARSLLVGLGVTRGRLPTLRRVEAIEEVGSLAGDITTAPEVAAIDPDQDLAFLPYSSGTTGMPKGVMLTHASLVTNTRQWISTGAICEDSVQLAFLPFYHIYGAVVLLHATVAMGATCVVMPRFDPAQVLELIERYRVTELYVVPPALLALAHHPATDRHDLSSLRFIASAAAPLPREVATVAADRLRCPVFQCYGMTEACPTHINPPDAWRDGSVGLPLPDVEQRIVDLETGAEVPVGATGELLVRGPQVMRGYWKQPAATAEAILAGGWVRTGDIARLDADGFLWLVDRAKEMIKYKGYQVAPAELEAVLMEHPAVLDAAVIPILMPGEGEAPKGFVVLKDGRQATAAAIMAFVAERVAPYKQLRALEAIGEIPKGPTGKILRRVLVEQDRARTSTT